MDVQWRASLSTVLASEHLLWVEQAVANEVAHEAESATPFTLFDDDDSEDSAAVAEAEVKKLLETCPSCLDISLDDIPLRYRSTSWLQVHRPGDLLIPVVLGTSRKAHGDVIWAAAEYCAEALVLGKADFLVGGSLQKRRVLEVGAGVGLPSCAALRKGAEVVASDLTDAQRLLALATSLALNQHAKVNGSHARVVPHVWGESCSELCAGGLYDLVLCCDCIYIPELHQPLLDTLRRCVAASGSVMLCFSLHGTAPDEDIFAFLDSARSVGFRVEPFGEKQMKPRCQNLPLKRSYVHAFALHMESAHP